MIKTKHQDLLSNVPEVTLAFWVVKILATTLGETGGDALSMSALDHNYLISTMVFGVIFAIAVTVQILAKQFHPIVYWITIVATTTVGTTMADFVDRSLGIGYAGGTTILFTLLMGSLWLWYRTLGSVAIETVQSPQSEVFYWVTIMFSQTLGTALGDWTSDEKGLGLGYTGAAIVFGCMLAAIAITYYLSKVNRTSLFWAAFILTRPMGAVVGDFLDKPVAQGGLALDRYQASTILVVLIVLCLFLFRSKAASRPH
jgi:uncharacterized membrane-anchored protein